MDMKPVTLWYRRFTAEQHLEFNHLEDGHNTSGTPVAVSKEQAQNWKNGQWDFEHAYLDKDSRVVRS